VGSLDVVRTFSPRTRSIYKIVSVVWRVTTSRKETISLASQQCREERPIIQRVSKQSRSYCVICCTFTA